MDLDIKTSPSAADRWMVCTASPKAIRDGNYVDKPTKWSKLGTEAHKYVANQLQSIPQSEDLNKELDYDFLHFYIDYVDATIPKENQYIELQCKNFYRPSTFCYVDACGFDGQGVFHIIDLKTGRNPVDAKGNLQMSIYALNACNKLSMLESFTNDTDIKLHIYQPNNINTRYYTFDDLLQFQNDVETKYHEIELDDVEFVPSKKGCKYCPIQKANDCRHYDQFMRGPLEEIQPDFKKLLSGVGIEKVVNLYKHRKVIKDALKDTEEYLLQKLMDGEEVSGLRLETSRTMRKWCDQGQAYRLLLRLFKKSEVVTEKLVSPKQAEELLKGRRKTKLVQELLGLIYSPKGKPCIGIDDGTKQLDQVNPEDVFTKYED